MRKPKTPAQLRKQLWKLFSEYIRRRDSADGLNRCFTCGVVKPWQMLHAGHYIRASAGLSTYFDEQNVNPQCYACNIWRDGNCDEYALALQRKYGEDILKQLNARKQLIVKNFPWQEKILFYTKLLNEMPLVVE